MTTETSTYFAAPERANEKDLQAEIVLVNRHALFKELMRAIGSIFAVLNGQRQVVAVNDAFLRDFEIDNLDDILGLRPGEVVGCKHVHDAPNGCGTGELCASCGAAVSIVASMQTGEPTERKCVLSTTKNGHELELCLAVRACPIKIGGQHFTLLLLQDVTTRELQASLEQIFFHDISNIVMALTGAFTSAYLDADGETSKKSLEIERLISRLATEIAVQRRLFNMDVTGTQPTKADVPVWRILTELRYIFAEHPAASGKPLVIPGDAPSLTLYTNQSMLLRVLVNMLVNAFEAADAGEQVQLWVENSGGRVCFCVWNHKHIPREIAPRVFQRHFSTKMKSGRGLGCYAMRLLGEHYLGGEVSFTSSPEDGTVFRFSLPV